MAKKKMHLLIIDPQNDFCDLPDPLLPRVDGEVMTPALPVAGAHADMLRVAALIDQGGEGLTDISITLDSHQQLDIAHPTFWQTGEGTPITPFTQILASQVRAGAYRPRAPGVVDRTLAYLDSLEANGRYRHMVWPVHCEIGTWGHNVHGGVRRAYNRWEQRQIGVVHKVGKGLNPWTEHYSAIKAEVPDPADTGTHWNADLLARLSAADTILIAGEAGSHCVKATTEHLVEYFDTEALSKLVLLTDCMSPVAGFEAQYADFLGAMGAQGVRVARSADILPELVANAQEQE